MIKIILNNNHADSGHVILPKGDLLLWRSGSKAGRTLWRERGPGRQVFLMIILKLIVKLNW